MSSTSEQKKLLKKIQNDPKLFNMMKNMQNIHTTSDSNKTPKEKLKDRLQSLQGKRNSSYSKEIQKERKIESLKQKELKDINEDKYDAEETIEKELNTNRKNKQKRLKQLEKKYGTITEEKYLEAMTYLQKYSDHESNNNKEDTNTTTNTFNSNDKAHYENLILLYNKQHKTISNKIETLSDSDDE